MNSKYHSHTQAEGDRQRTDMTPTMRVSTAIRGTQAEIAVGIVRDPSRRVRKIGEKKLYGVAKTLNAKTRWRILKISMRIPRKLA